LLRHTESRLCHVNLPRIFLFPIRGGHWRKSTNDRERKLKINSDADFGKNLELVSVFIAAIKIFIFMFILKKAAEKLKTNGHVVQI
jgi:hypothetical protein